MTRSTPAATDTDKLDAADGLKQAVSEQSTTIGDVVEALDALALKVGDFRLSAWDAAVMLMVIVGILAGAYFASKLARGAVRRLTRLTPSQSVLAEKLVSIGVWAFALMVGVPARRIGWMSRHGERLGLPVRGEGEATCPATGERYRLVGDVVIMVE